MERRPAKGGQPSPEKIKALRVEQWLPEWEKVKWDQKLRRRKPQPWFYQLSIRAGALKALSGVHRRTTDRGSAKEDTGIQRRHESERSKEIERYVRSGYPWSILSNANRESGEFDDVRKPGWLPTAIVVNILGPDDDRGGKKVDEADLIKVEQDGDGGASVFLPEGFSGASWRAKELHPIEVIDGQHRLWAFEDLPEAADYQLPVVAFHRLDISWQAYLFYTINIKPKKINASLAFDLYPLLRTEDWLEKAEGHLIYRETRAQELVDLLWSHPDSPWHKRINMLGETGAGTKMVSQAAWIRSLLATMVKSSEGRRVSIGGLFGAPVGEKKQTLSWSRAEQAAILIAAGDALRKAVKGSESAWANELRSASTGQQELPVHGSDDPAFYGRHSLLSHDQGIRAFLHTVNDLLIESGEDLEAWAGGDGSETDEVAVSEALRALKGSAVGAFLRELAKSLARFDWRSSDTPGLKESERVGKAALRGSSGYKELRRALLLHIEGSGGKLGSIAAAARVALGYTKT